MSDYKPIQSKVYDKWKHTGPDVSIAWNEVATPEAQFAKQLIERWGMVAGIEDGEDSAGRTKFRLATKEEVVNRACEVTESLFTEFRSRGWMVKVPLPLQEVEDPDAEATA